MCKTVIKEYKNERIHSTARPLTARSLDDKNEEKNYCDSLPVEFENISLKRTIEFTDVPVKTFSFGITFNGTTVSSAIDPFYLRNQEASYNERLELFNTFKIGDIQLDFENRKTIERDGLAFNLIEYTAENDLASGKIEIVFNYSKCPRCHKSFINPFYGEPKTKLLGVHFYDDEEQFKLSMSYKQIAVNLNFGWNRYYKDMIIYKKDTGKIYQIKNINTAGSSYLKNKNKTSIRDITFSSSDIFNLYSPLGGESGEYIQKGYAKFIEMIEKDLKEKAGSLYDYTKNDLEKLYLEEDSLLAYRKNRIATFSRLLSYEHIYYVQIKRKYNIQNTLLAKLIYHARKNNVKTHSIIKNMTEKEIMNYFKVNTKRLKKIQDNDEFSSYVQYFDLFEDQNNLNKLIEKPFNGANFYRSTSKYKDFYYQYRQNNTEKRFVNQLLSNVRSYYLVDTASLFTQIKAKMKDYSVDYSKPIRELHDIFVKDYNKLRHENRKISINKTIDKIFKNFSVNNITYNMPKDTDELVRVGAFMDICVGGYGDRAVKKECYIVIGYNENNKPVTCIELRKNENSFKVVQVKKRKNYTPKDSEANALKKLFEDNNIGIDTGDLKESRYRKLSEDDSELILERNKFTYAVGAPDEILQELLEVI